MKVVLSFDTLIASLLPDSDAAQVEILGSGKDEVFHANIIGNWLSLEIPGIGPVFVAIA